jgi:hypothetical protein
LIGLCNEERECRSPRGDASIGTLCSRGNSHCVDREFSFYDLALIALAARKSRKIKRGSRGSREPSKFPHTMPGLGQASLRASNFSAANWRKGRVRRSAKGPPFDATECDAQHKNAASQTAKPPAPPRLAALPSSPIRAVFLDGIRRVVEPAVKRLKSSPRPHSSVPRGDGQYDEERLAPR